MKVSVELLAVLKRRHRLRAVDDNLVLFVDQLAPEGPHQPVRPARVSRRIAERITGRVPFAFSAWHSFRNPGMSLGKVSNPAAFIELSR